jgi:ADP-ribose pyrophosphatase
MTLKAWPTIARKTVADCTIFSVETLTVSDPRNESLHKRSVIHFRNWCNVVALTKEKQLILVRQFRFGTQCETLELPGGVIEPSEPAVTAAARELEEETGFRAGALTFIGRAHPNPALQGNVLECFLATDCVKIHDGQPDEGEDLEVLLLDRDDIVASLQSGAISHALALSALFFAKLKLPTLF